ncbi:PAS domain S-box protein [Pseudidiomarina sp. 1APR75-33.1]|uniref:PAS domain S-box protein n=1 Tax=Pseudidiomarina terrestris TaxID=2820060 RepID=UPI002655AA1A|nr:PAS domain S-box protein [Pseudidiomarina sp. 1APR75-33.1]MDN7128187.1 PAS domain S-box protein [Pseudidiomarina sp. 1APR75-33.1]
MHRRVTLVSAAVALGLGIVVMIGWWMRSSTIVQLHPAFTPMQFNTALGFFCAGIILLSLVLDKTKVALAFSLLLLILGLATGFQYAISINLGIDELFLNHELTTGTTSPGRMAPNTAVSFVLAGLLGYILSQRHWASNLKAFYGQMLALTVLAIAIIATIGYLFGLKLAYSWAGLTNMALHTALGFIVTATGFITLSLELHEQRVRQFAIVFTGCVFLATLLVDLSAPHGFDGAIFYPALMLCAFLFKPLYTSYILAPFAIVLASLGYYASSRSEFDATADLINRGVAIALVVIVALIIVQIKNYLQLGQRLDQRLQLSAEALDIGLWDWIPKTGEIHFSKSYYELLGYEGNELEESVSGWLTLVHPEERTHVESTLRNYATSPDRSSAEMEFRMQHKDGSWRRVYARWKGTERTKEGYPIRLVGMLHDTTEKDRKEEELLLLKSAIEHSETMVIVTSIETTSPKIIYVSDNAKSVCGYRSAELIGQSPEVLQSPRDKLENEEALSALREALANEHAFQGEVWISSKQGERIRLRLSAFPIRAADGEALYFSSIAYNNSELYEIEQAAAQQQEQLKSAMMNSPIGMALVAPNTRWLDANKALCTMLGYSKEELLETSFVDLTHPEDIDADLGQVQKMLNHEINSYEMEKRYIHKDGHIVWALLTVSLVWSEDDTPLHFISQIQNISKRKRDEEKLKAYTEELEQSNRDLDDFAYIASHDLKEPLRGINNHALMLQRKYQSVLDDAGNHKLNRMVLLSQKMEKLISDLLFFSRIGREKDFIKPVDIDKIVRQEIDLLASYLDEQNASVLIASDLPILSCNENKVSVIFRNLIFNGIKYNDKEHKRISVTYDKDYDKDGTKLAHVFHVTDNGIGIEEEFQEDIFRMFKRLHSEKAYGPGTGAGLAFVKKIIDMNGGTIWLDSTPKQGTTFHFSVNEESQNATY